MTTSNFYCTKCGQKGIPIPRINGKERQGGHLKKLYCLQCKKEVNMVEIRECGKYNKKIFDLEYKYGNFNENGERILPYTQFLHQLKNKGVI